MKFNKQIIIILTLTSLLLSAIGGAYYFYIQNQKALKVNNQLRAVFVASRDIPKDTKITKKDLKQINIARKYILSTPLLKKEIIGKYAKENIYKNDMFRKKKLSKNLPQKKIITKKEAFVFNCYNMGFKLFQNPNYSLQKDDIINIISVYPASMRKSNNSPNAVQYVASQIRIIGFLIDGKKSTKAIDKRVITKTVKRKKIKQTIEKKAQELLLDIDGKILLSLIDDYNRGKQLWMVKTHKIVKKPKKTIKKPTIKQYKKQIKRSYPFKLYKPKNGSTKISATIHYGDEKDAAVTKRKIIKIDMQKQCRQTHQYLLGISNRVHLRRGHTFGYKIMRVVYRNYIIPYKTKVNDNWYETCDGLYVHKNEIKTLTLDQAKRRLAKVK